MLQDHKRELLGSPSLGENCVAGLKERLWKLESSAVEQQKVQSQQENTIKQLEQVGKPFPGQHPVPCLQCRMMLLKYDMGASLDCSSSFSGSLLSQGTFKLLSLTFRSFLIQFSSARFSVTSSEKPALITLQIAPTMLHSFPISLAGLLSFVVPAIILDSMF